MTTLLMSVMLALALCTIAFLWTDNVRLRRNESVYKRLMDEKDALIRDAQSLAYDAFEAARKYADKPSKTNADGT